MRQKSMRPPCHSACVRTLGCKMRAHRLRKHAIPFRCRVNHRAHTGVRYGGQSCSSTTPFASTQRHCIVRNARCSRAAAPAFCDLVRRWVYLWRTFPHSRHDQDWSATDTCEWAKGRRRRCHHHHHHHYPYQEVDWGMPLKRNRASSDPDTVHNSHFGTSCPLFHRTPQCKPFSCSKIPQRWYNQALCWCKDCTRDTLLDHSQAPSTPKGTRTESGSRTLIEWAGASF